MKAQPANSCPQPEKADDENLASIERLLGFNPTLESRPRSKLVEQPHFTPPHLSPSAPGSKTEEDSTWQGRLNADGGLCEPPPRGAACIKFASWMAAPRSSVRVRTAEHENLIPQAVTKPMERAPEKFRSKWYTASVLAARPVQESRVPASYRGITEDASPPKREATVQASTQKGTDKPYRTDWDTRIKAEGCTDVLAAIIKGLTASVVVVSLTLAWTSG